MDARGNSAEGEDSTQKLRIRGIKARSKPAIALRAPSYSTPTSPKQSPSPTSPQSVSPQGVTSPRHAQSTDKRRACSHTSYSSAPSSPRSSPSSPPSPTSRASTSARESTVDGRRRFFGPRAADGLWPSIRSLSSSVPTNKTVTQTVKYLSSLPLKGRNITEKPEILRNAESSDPAAADRRSLLAIPIAKPHVDHVTRIMERPAVSVLLRGVSPPRKKHVSDAADRTNRETSPDVCMFPSQPFRAQHMILPKKVSLPPASSCRGTASPSRVRPSKIFLPPIPSIAQMGVSNFALNYILDGRQQRKNASQVEDAHQLLLLENRYLQWRFVNVQAEAASSLQKVNTEDDLYSVWLNTSKLMSSITDKKTAVQQLRQEMRLESILNDQMGYLKEWDSLENEHSDSLSETIETLKWSVVRVPVLGRARADVRAVRNAISSSADVLQATSSSVSNMLSPVEDVDSMISELASISAEEKAKLKECHELLATIAAMQVQELSLRTHLLQLRQELLRCEASKFFLLRP